MELNRKKIIGILYPAVVFAFIIFIYFALVVCPFFLNRQRMFGSPFNTVYSIICLVVIHVFFVVIVYCYLSCIFRNPGMPPKFWVG